MANTTNFGWETPDDTDLVKDGAAAIRTLGSAIDTSLVDLKGGTTGQVLSKNSNTDMDFTWTAQDDSNAIQNAIVDAKGDLISATAADTPARLAVGTNGHVLTADSTTATGLKWAAINATSMTLLSTTTLPGNTTSTEISGISGDYTNLIIYGYGLAPATAATMSFQLGHTSLQNAFGVNMSGGVDVFAGNRTNNAAVSSVKNLDNSTTSALHIQIPFYSATNNRKMCLYSWLDNNGNAIQGTAWFSGIGDSAVSRFGLSSAQNISGTILIYGVK